MRTSSPASALATKIEDQVLPLLRRHAIRHTPVRRAVLEVLLQSPFALSSAEVEKQLPTSSDRITLHRTPRIFEKKARIHRVIDNSDTVRYAVCIDSAASASHVHFKCTTCLHIYCLNQVAVPVVKLPG